MSEDECDCDSEDMGKLGWGLVRGTDPRWAWLSTVASAVTIISFVLYVGLAILGMATVTALTQGWFALYLTVVLGAVVYVFGRETLEVVYRFRNGGFDK